MMAYIYCADIYCEECGEVIKDELKPLELKHTDDSDSFPQGPYSDGGGEADCPQHCGMCGVFLENPLTSDGRAYVEARLKTIGHTRSRLRKLWSKFYEIPCPDEENGLEQAHGEGTDSKVHGDAG